MTYNFIEEVSTLPPRPRKNSKYRNAIEGLLNDTKNNLSCVSFQTSQEAKVALPAYLYFLRRYHYPLILFRRHANVYLLKISEKKEIDTEVKVTGGFS
jgi:hypothetical protein